MNYYTIEKNGFEITTNPVKIDVNRLHNFLAEESYWSQKIPIKLLEKALSNSLNYSIIEVSTKIFVGFARLITDKATFAYLADVFVDESFRGKGLGKWLIETIMNYSEVQNLRFWFLMTRDAHGLYSQFGWKPLSDPQKAMAIRKPAIELYESLQDKL